MADEEDRQDDVATDAEGTEATAVDEIDEAAAGESADAAETADSEPDVPVRTPQFAELQGEKPGQGAPIDRFYDVSVTVSAELGRVSMSLGELLKMGDGSVVKLDRPVTAPVELMAQGVRVALGEVVVVDDCFAIRVKEIERTRKGN